MSLPACHSFLSDYSCQKQLPPEGLIHCHYWEQDKQKCRHQRNSKIIGTCGILSPSLVSSLATATESLTQRTSGRRGSSWLRIRAGGLSCRAGSRSISCPWWWRLPIHISGSGAEEGILDSADFLTPLHIQGRPPSPWDSATHSCLSQSSPETPSWEPPQEHITGLPIKINNHALI